MRVIERLESRVVLWMSDYMLVHACNTLHQLAQPYDIMFVLALTPVKVQD